MLEILINNQPIQLLQPPPPIITSLRITVQFTPFHPLHVQQGMGKPIMEWLYNITQSVTHIITYNGIIISKDSINKPPHIKGYL